MTATQLVRIVGTEKAVELVMIGGRLPTMDAVSDELKRLLVLKLYGEKLETSVISMRTGLSERACRDIRANKQ